MSDYSIDTMFCSDQDNSIISIESTNSIYFSASITPKTSSLLIDKLIMLEKIITNKHNKLKRKYKEFCKIENKDDDDDDNIKITFEYKPIKLYITSNGGYVYQVFSIIDTIKSLVVPVHTICRGFVASAGTLLSLAGEKRFITENSYMLIHELRAGTWGKYTHMFV